jgi:hypothetical protein
MELGNPELNTFFDSPLGDVNKLTAEVVVGLLRFTILGTVIGVVDMARNVIHPHNALFTFSFDSFDMFKMKMCDIGSVVRYTLQVSFPLPSSITSPTTTTLLDQLNFIHVCRHTLTNNAQHTIISWIDAIHAISSKL